MFVSGEGYIFDEIIALINTDAIIPTSGMKENRNSKSSYILFRQYYFKYYFNIISRQYYFKYYFKYSDICNVITMQMYVISMI